MLNKDDILGLANLSKLEISEDKLEHYLEEITKKIKALEIIKEVNTGGVDLTYNVNGMKNPLREDVIKASLARESVLKNTKEEQYGYFKILNVMD